MNRWKSWIGESLWKRTALSVSGMLVGSALFIGMISFGLVAVTEGLLSPNKGRASGAADDDTTAPAESGTASPKSPLKIPLKPKRAGQSAKDHADEEPLP